MSPQQSESTAVAGGCHVLASMGQCCLLIPCCTESPHNACSTLVCVFYNVLSMKMKGWPSQCNLQDYNRHTKCPSYSTANNITMNTHYQSCCHFDTPLNVVQPEAYNSLIRDKMDLTEVSLLHLWLCLWHSPKRNASAGGGQSAYGCTGQQPEILHNRDWGTPEGDPGVA